MLGRSQLLQHMSKALDLRVQRHQVLASNIANADTPHFKARDFDFSKAMSNATAGMRGGLAMATTDSGHLTGAIGFGTPNLLYRSDTQSAVDGNTVDMDVERAQIAENSLQHQILTNLISDSFKTMRVAISSNQS